MTVEDVAIKGVRDVREDKRDDSALWRSDSLCRRHPTQWWFAGGAHETVLAKGICAGCVVQEPCLEFALGRPELLGVWASTTPSERAAMRRARRAVDDAPVVDAPVVDAPVVDAPVVDAPVVDAPVVDIDLSVEAAAETAAAAPPRPAVEIEIEVGARSAAAVPPAARDNDEGDGTASSRPAPPRYRSRGRQASAGRAERNEPSELLTPAEAARKLGVTPNTVTRWSRDGKISAIQTMGGHRRFRREEIERLLGPAGFVTPPVRSPGDSR